MGSRSKNSQMIPRLLVRLLMQSGQRGGRRTRAEAGYSLAVALIAAFVLLLGVGALASRGQFGFVGQVFQEQNRDARDVAEAAITEFANTLNQERNRHLLIAGTTDNWDSARWTDNKGNPTDLDFRNVCTAIDNNFNPIQSGSPLFVDPDTTAIARLSLGGPQNLVAGDNSRQFTVESIEFLPQDRNVNGYVDKNTGNFLNFDQTVNGVTTSTSYGTVYRTGSQRSLIRITVVGSITENGRTSTARVAREFEVVPKCCKRSFGRNVFGGQNWGRDTQTCGAPSGPSGLIAGMNGGLVGGSKNEKQIFQEDGSRVTEAACWNGNLGTPSDLTEPPNPICSTGKSTIANISFVPSKFNYVAPVYAHPSGETPAAPEVSTSSSPSFLYFDIERFNAQANNKAGVGQPASPTDKNAFSGIVLSSPSKSGQVRTRIDGQPLDDSSPDPCYTQLPDAANGRPYYTVNCRVTSIIPPNNDFLYIDTSVAKINFFFQGNGNSKGDYGIGSGTGGTYRIHGDKGSQLRSNLTTALVSDDESNCVEQADVSGCLIAWPAPGTVTAASRLNTFLELCADRSYNCDISTPPDNEEDYSVRRLLNFYTMGSGSFTINGTTTGVGYNIYAPFANVRVNGGGQADNFMGQIWTNNLTLNGNVKIQTFSGGGGLLTGNGPSGFAFGRPLIDFIARSFTQSSGFGL